MTYNVTIDWKFVVAIGSVAIGSILALKMDTKTAAEVSKYALDAFKEYAIAVKGNR